MHDRIIEGMERELKQLKLRLAATRKWRAYVRESGSAEREVTDELVAQDHALAEELERWLGELKSAS